MRPVGVAEVLVLAQHDHQVLLIPHQGPVQSWVVKQARNLFMDLGDAGARANFVLHDRDASFAEAFDAVFQAAGIWVIRSAVQAPRMNSIMERWIGSCLSELLDRTLIWNQRHLMMVLREYEDFCNSHRPHRALDQAAPLRPLPDGITDLDHLRLRRHDRTGGVIHEYRLVAQGFRHWPCWASRRRRLAMSIGRGIPLRRRSAQYPVRAGSSGGDVPLTIWCRTIFVPANRRR